MAVFCFLNQTQMQKRTQLFSIFLLISILFPLGANNSKASLADDADYYSKYPLYEKYEKKQKYGKYKKLQKIVTSLGFDDKTTKAQAKDGYTKYKQYKKNPKQFPQYSRYLPQYNSYKKYLGYAEYGKYKKYKKYDKKEYDKYKKYGGSEYKAGYERYLTFMHDLSNVTTDLGPEISVGLWSKNHIDAQESNDPFRITANKAFTVTKCDSTVIGTVQTTSNVRVAYAGSAQLKVYNTDLTVPATTVNERVCLQAADGNNTDMIFDVNTPSNISKAGYDHYRGKIKIQHSYSTDNYNLYNNSSFADNDPSHAMRRIWVINTLPLEQYMWGYGEMAKGGTEDFAKTMIVAARSYARWHLAYGTKWGETPSIEGETGEGFNILSYSFSQIYNGYDYETAHSFIPEAAKKTNGIIMKYSNEYVLGAYCSYTDGNTRSLDGYPYLVSVSDPYGKNSSLTTDQMIANGNHMWGLSANGGLTLASDYGWPWTRILSYYYSGIDIVKEY